MTEGSRSRSGEGIDEKPLFLPGSKIQFVQSNSEQVRSFETAWENLPVDEYQVGTANPRERRHCRFILQGDQLRLAPPGAYYQSTANNPLYGGIQRIFAPVEPAYLKEGAFLSTLLRFNLSILPLPYKDVTINCHLIRIKTSIGIQGEPAPEGAHSDGFDYISIHLVRKLNCKGGHSVIYDQKKDPVLEVTLNDPFDSLFVNDRLFTHFTTPVFTEKKAGFRDMLLCSYERYEDLSG